MNRLLLLLLILLLLPSAAPQAEEIGAFFTKINTYVFTKSPAKGKRFLIRPRQAFTVVNLTTDGQDRLWLQIVYPGRTAKVKGTGWTPLAPHELLDAGNKPVEVFSDVFEGNGAPPESVEVPASDVELLNVTQPSKKFSQVTWQKVKYETAKPLRPWIRGAAGIFRPGRSSEFLSRVYVEMVSRNLPKGKLDRLLAGVVRVGDTSWDVERALGKPLRIQGNSTAVTGRATWEYSSLVVHFTNQVVDRIN